MTHRSDWRRTGVSSIAGKLRLQPQQASCALCDKSVFSLLYDEARLTKNECKIFTCRKLSTGDEVRWPRSSRVWRVIGRGRHDVTVLTGFPNHPHPRGCVEDRDNSAIG